MEMSRRDRIRLKTQIVQELEYQPEWNISRVNLVLDEFDLGRLRDSFEGPSVSDLIGNVSDELLKELYSVVMDVDVGEVEDVVESASSNGNWKPGYARLFLSHSAMHKEFVGKVANQLAVVGIHGFVAHDTMEVSQPWQTQIETFLRTMQAFVALVHPEFNGSAWCNQEVGWALGRRVPRYVIRLGVDPAGFIGRDQWPSLRDDSASRVADEIRSWVVSLPELGSSIADNLISALEAAGNYVSAGATAERLASLESLTAEQFSRLDAVWWSNDQLCGGNLPTQALRPFYRKNKRPWPPERPS